MFYTHIRVYCTGKHFTRILLILWLFLIASLSTPTTRSSSLVNGLNTTHTLFSTIYTVKRFIVLNAPFCTSTATHFAHKMLINFRNSVQEGHKTVVDKQTKRCGNENSIIVVHSVYKYSQTMCV